jgi:hypothetical protein
MGGKKHKGPFIKGMGGKKHKGKKQAWGEKNIPVFFPFFPGPVFFPFFPGPVFSLNKKGP